jgi:arabinose-5-phosphate isomerase
LHDEYPTLEKSHAKLIKSYALQAISDELNSVAALKTYIDEGFEAAIELLLSNKGRAIITGIGKSAIIAQKIVATMNSTGQPAIFMHAADAVHGDLGIIQKGDVVIAISKSGNTPEIKLLAPLLKSFGNPLIAMVGNVNSELAGLADVVINTTIDKEACPNNLAPTTSTTAQLIMGDALAVTLLRMRNFSDDDFGRYHPGGALGKRLYLRCGDIAAANAKPAVMPEASIKEVILSISANRLGAATVVNTTGQVLGIITDGDIRRMLESRDNLHDLKAADIMGKNPASVDWDNMATEAAEIMKTRKISQLVVLKNDNYAGMVHLHDLNREGII